MFSFGVANLKGLRELFRRVHWYPTGSKAVGGTHELLLFVIRPSALDGVAFGGLEQSPAVLYKWSSSSILLLNLVAVTALNMLFEMPPLSLR